MGILGSIIGQMKTGNAMDKKYEIADIYRDLRHQVLTIKPSEIGLSQATSSEVWGVLMETGYPEAVATLVTMADGTVSLYFSNGGGIIGVGEHEGPRKARESLLSAAQKYIEHAKQTNDFPLPKEGNTRFYFLTYDGVFTAEHKEDDLGNERLPLSPLFFEAHEVISQARIVDDQLKVNFQNLMYAATNGDTATVKKLLDEGANPNRSDKTGLSPLMAAAYSGQDSVVRILIENRSDIDAKDSSGYTALMFAANAGKGECAKLLVKHGADINAKDNDGSTPLMFAAQHGYNEIVSFLLEKGANPLVVGSHGLSAVGFAEQNDHKETLEILRRR